ncbi:protein of unknown function [Streptococcus thermophilus]|uniref:Uncharacterized protein n=1 Tax=Streptococcus thermophilus TaxID=1308 RepID=A0A8D6XTV3_STRTR|nr:protein of unknown function [Streptococcus thermophilus]CAD0152992.1 protein of unknown function [Streptococcus thermophilus]
MSSSLSFSISNYMLTRLTIKHCTLFITSLKTQGFVASVIASTAF